MDRPRAYELPLRLAAAALIALAAGAALYACAAKKSPGPPPAWMDPDAPASDAQYFYGKGCAQKEVNNDYLKRDIARERARTDLAMNVHRYLMSQLDGDTTAARAALEAALPSYQITGSYADGRGTLCARARLSRSLIILPQALPR